VKGEQGGGMIYKTVLENGIRVVTEEIPTAHSVTLGFWVENGSRHEDLSQCGISHFIEHMLFKGTERRNALEIAKEIDSVGGVLNAFTSREFSCYYAKVLAKRLPLAIDLLSDIVLHSVLDPDEIEKERRVILQEIHMVDDTPDDQVHELFCQTFWENHPLGHSILGTWETVGNISRDHLLSFLEDRYCGKNILICAAGDLKHEQLVENIDRAFRLIKPGERPPLCSLPEYRHRLNILEKDLEQVHICLGTRALPQNHPNRFVSFLMNTILGGGMSSRLFQNVREDLGLAYSIYSYLNCHSDAGALVVSSGTSPNEAPKVLHILLKELDRFRTEPVAEEELHSAKEQLKGNLLLSLESTDNRMTRLAKNEIYLGRNLSIKEVIRGIDQVSIEDIQKLAGFIFKDDYLNLQMVGKVRQSDYPLSDLTLG
jgi:predicted Zn-dependent peptidase